jgi:hypothetical protein
MGISISQSRCTRKKAQIEIKVRDLEPTVLMEFVPTAAYWCSDAYCILNDISLSRHPNGRTDVSRRAKVLVTWRQSIVSVRSVTAKLCLIETDPTLCLSTLPSTVSFHGLCKMRVRSLILQGCQPLYAAPHVTFQISTFCLNSVFVYLEWCSHLHWISVSERRRIFLVVAIVFCTRAYILVCM